MAYTAVSAPGKVLLAGGYLVLDRAYTGLVFGLSARIHVVVQDVETSSGVELSEIVVQSPQFRDAQWRYGYHLTEKQGGVKVTPLYGASSSSLSRNPFVETALCYALTYISSVTGPKLLKPASITILADNDYYSQPSKSTSSAEASAQQFSDFGVRLQDAHKTGLGSSAALVTAFTGAVLSHYLSKSVFDISTSEGQARLHNLAQAAHCAAQGKVGSGFDVAAAVYGTCVYRRFSPSILSVLGEAGSEQFSERVRKTVENTESWDTEVQKGAAPIPEGMRLIMCDVDCGSQTVGMVKKVLEWKKQDPTGSEMLWDRLQAENEVLASSLSTGNPDEIGMALVSIRGYIRDMGKMSGAPIEPPEQTALLDALTCQVEGVCGGVVPGAGGFDAVALLVKDDEATMSAITKFLKEWSVSKASNVKLLGVKGEMEGVKKEAKEMYVPWIQ